MTSRLRARWRSRLVVEVRPPPRSARPGLAPAYLNTGIAPNSRPAASDNPSVKSRTGRSSVMSSSRGRLPGASATSSRNAPNARPSPTTPPRRPSVTLSSSSSRAIRADPAPSAARIASSCCRDSALTRSRFATFAHAMRRTSPIVAISTHKTVRTSPTRSSLSESTLGRIRASSNILTLPPGNGGKRVSEIGISRATSAVAWSIEIPGFSRATPE